ncbi:MAG: hypothetical protein IPK39_21895 [Sulfuritalea sp.]|nr:hypothetical protein [Sulfuritalea sp.]
MAVWPLKSCNRRRDDRTQSLGFTGFSMNRSPTGAALALCRLTLALPVKAAIAANSVPDSFPAKHIDGLMRNADA